MHLFGLALLFIWLYYLFIIIGFIIYLVLLLCVTKQTIIHYLFGE